MEALRRDIGSKYSQQMMPLKPTPSPFLSPIHFAFKLLFSILFGGLILTTGPAALRTAADASSMMVHVFLELCRVSLFVIHILGK
jgi:hypothetical protein